MIHDDAKERVAQNVSRQEAGISESGGAAPLRDNRHRNTFASRRSFQEMLKIVWCDVLDIDQVGLDDDFFELGGSSCEALDVVDRINGREGIEISTVGLFENPTIRAMSELLLSGESIEYRRIVEESRRRGEERRADEQVRAETAI
jgi:aryl carrier-like protein